MRAQESKELEKAAAAIITVLQAMITPDILLREMMFLNSRFGVIKSCSNKGFKAYTICCIRIRNK
jgi:hypothetical protein